MHKQLRRGRRTTAVTACGVLAAPFTAVVTAGAFTAGPAGATPVARQFRIAGTDWTAAGVGGIGNAVNGGGTATITVAGVSGTVTHAYLMWSGIGWDATVPQGVGVYNNPSITMNGSPVTGTSQGESGSNCWGSASTSRTYLADVTGIVAAAGGNGTFDLAGLGDGGDANGADLVVTYDDGNAANNRDLYLFYGNDTDAAGYPGEDFVWNDPLTAINYQGGVANVLLGVSDGQDFGNPDDGDLVATGAGATLDFPDDATTGFLWDGESVPDMGHSRATNGSLFDLKSFDMTGAFGDPGTQDLTLSTALVNDCHSLDMVAVDVQATGNVPPPPQTVSVSPASDVEGTAPLPSGKFTHMVFKVTLSAKSAVPVTVTLQTQDGTATAPGDYKSATRTITIPAGKRAKAFKVNVVPDSVAEGNEYFYAVIDSASVPVATNAAVGEIIDDDVVALARHASVAHATNGGTK